MKALLSRAFQKPLWCGSLALAASLVISSCKEKPAPQPLVNTTPPVAITPPETAPKAVPKPPAASQGQVQVPPPPAAMAKQAPVQPAPPPPVVKPPPEPPIALDAPEVRTEVQGIKTAGAALLAWKEGDPPEAKEESLKAARKHLMQLAKFRTRVEPAKVEEWDNMLKDARKDFLMFNSKNQRGLLDATKERLENVKKLSQQRREEAAKKAAEQPR